MLQAIVLSFLAGLIGTNGLPHLVRGITAQEYPATIGNSPLRNAVAGWAAVVIAALLAFWSDVERHVLAGIVAAAVGALVMVVFHARGGAFWLNTRFGHANPPGPER